MHFVAVVLKQDMAGLVVTEVCTLAEFAALHQGIEHLVVAIVFHDLHAVEPVLDVVVLYDDPGGIPLAHTEVCFILVGTDKVVEGTQGTVAGYTELGIGMHLVVEYLELASDCGRIRRIEVGIDEVLDTTVGTLGEEEIYGEFGTMYEHWNSPAQRFKIVKVGTDKRTGGTIFKFPNVKSKKAFASGGYGLFIIKRVR